MVPFLHLSNRAVYLTVLCSIVRYAKYHGIGHALFFPIKLCYMSQFDVFQKESALLEELLPHYVVSEVDRRQQRSANECILITVGSGL